MISKTLSYDDFDGNPVKETYWFHLSEADIIEIDSNMGGTLVAKLTALAESNDTAFVIKTFKELIGWSVGRRSEDGKQFVKTPQIVGEFLNSNAWAAFLMDVVTNVESAIEWFVGVMPKNLQKDVTAEYAKQRGTLSGSVQQKMDKALANTTTEDRRAVIEDLFYTGELESMGLAYSKTSLAEPKDPLDYSVDLTHLQKQELFEKQLDAYAQSGPEPRGFTGGKAIVDEWAQFEEASARDTNWRSYSPQQLLDMDDDIFGALCGPVKPGTDKILLTIMMRRRARKNGS